MESCALDGEVYMHRRGRAEHERVKVGVKVGVSNLQTELGRYKTEKREKVGFRPGLRECRAGYETYICGKLRITLDGEGYMHRRRGAEHGLVKVGVSNRTWPIQDGERERK